jgi:hypothetical protein
MDYKSRFRIILTIAMLTIFIFFIFLGCMVVFGFWSSGGYSKNDFDRDVLIAIIAAILSIFSYFKYIKKKISK